MSMTWSSALRSEPRLDREVCLVLLLQIGDEVFLGVQLIPQAADLFLMALPVRLDLLLHSILTKQMQAAAVTTFRGRAHMRRTIECYTTLTSLADWISFSIRSTFSERRQENVCLIFLAYIISNWHIYSKFAPLTAQLSLMCLKWFGSWNLLSFDGAYLELLSLQFPHWESPRFLPAVSSSALRLEGIPSETWSSLHTEHASLRQKKKKMIRH